MTGKNQQRLSPEQIKQHLREWQRSGLDLRQYSAQMGHSYWTLRRWRLQYAEQVGIAVMRRPGASRKPRSAIIDKPTMVPIDVVSPLQQACVEIELTASRTVRVPIGVDVRFVARLVQAIEAAQ